MTNNEKNGGEFHRLFLSLEGKWSLRREYSNGNAFEGTASFTKIQSKLFQVKEEGKLTLSADSEPMQAERKWHWHLDAKEQISIFYPPKVGGALYHRLNFKKVLNGWAASDLHLCAPDEYFGEYLLCENEVKISHKVKGPKKNYQFTATYYQIL